MSSYAKYLVLVLTALYMTGCGGGGGSSGGGSNNGGNNGGGSGTPSYTHDQLAAMFVDGLNASGVYDVTLAKSTTLQGKYIVIFDHDFGTYDAIDITGYSSGSNALDFINRNSSSMFYGLDEVAGHYEYENQSVYDVYCGCYFTELVEVWIPTRFHDFYTGYVFEKSTTSAKDLETLAALAEEAVVINRAESVSAKFGLSVERSREVVRLGMAWQKAGGKDLTDKDQDAFSEELLGFSITAAKSAAQAAATGNKAPMEDLINKAANVNDTSPELIRQIVDMQSLQ